MLFLTPIWMSNAFDQITSLGPETIAYAQADMPAQISLADYFSGGLGTVTYSISSTTGNVGTYASIEGEVLDLVGDAAGWSGDVVVQGLDDSGQSASTTFTLSLVALQAITFTPPAKVWAPKSVTYGSGNPLMVGNDYATGLVDPTFSLVVAPAGFSVTDVATGKIEGGYSASLAAPADGEWTFVEASGDPGAAHSALVGYTVPADHSLRWTAGEDPSAPLASTSRTVSGTSITSGYNWPPGTLLYGALDLVHNSATSASLARSSIKSFTTATAAVGTFGPSGSAHPAYLSPNGAADQLVLAWGPAPSSGGYANPVVKRIITDQSGARATETTTYDASQTLTETLTVSGSTQVEIWVSTDTSDGAHYTTTAVAPSTSTFSPGDVTADTAHSTKACYLCPRYGTEGSAVRTMETGRIGTRAWGGSDEVEWMKIGARVVTAQAAAGFAGSGWVPDGPGEITGVVRRGGTRYSVQGESHAKVPIISNPLFADEYNGSGKLAMIPPYPTYGAGQSFASVSALNSAISALNPGDTLIVENATFSGGTIRPTAKDYGGVEVIARNMHGVTASFLEADGCKNITFRGFRIGQKAGAESAGTDGITFDYIYAYWFRAGIDASDIYDFTMTNCVALGNAKQSTFKNIFPFRMRSCIFGGGSGADLIQIKGTSSRGLSSGIQIFWQHVVVGDGQTSINSTHHTDHVQFLYGELSGSVEHSFVGDIYDSNHRGMQGWFYGDGDRIRDFHQEWCGAYLNYNPDNHSRRRQTNAETFQKPEWNVTLRNSTTNKNLNTESSTGSTYNDSMHVENCIIGGKSKSTSSQADFAADPNISIPRNVGDEVDNYDFNDLVGSTTSFFPHYVTNNGTPKGLLHATAYQGLGWGAFAKQIEDA